MDNKELQAIAKEAAKNIKTEADLNEFRHMLTKIMVETVLNAELDDRWASTSTNSQSAITAAMATPARHCKPKRASLNWIRREWLVRKYQRRFTSMDDKILFLYAQGMTTWEIVTTFKEIYNADASTALISKVTDAVMEQVVEWQS